MKKINVVAVVVAFNPKPNDLISLVDNLLNQVSKVVICNNSSYPLDFIWDDRVVTKNFMDNLGIAQAQNIGMEYAFHNQADFVLQMDQDSKPSKEMVQELLNSFYFLSKHGVQVGLIGPQDYNNDTGVVNAARVNKGKRIMNGKCMSVTETLSSGSLIPRSTYMSVGGMKEDLFIDAVDFEYCWRIVRFGLEIIRDESALLGHMLGDGRQKILAVVEVNVGSPIRHYYQFRNILLLSRAKHAPFYWKISNLAKIIIKLIFYPMFLHHGAERLRFMLLGIKDGLQRVGGRIDRKVNFHL